MNKKYKLEKIKIDAYFTVEASFMIPLVLMIFFVIIYTTFFLYNHCVVSQVIYTSVLRGQQLKNEKVPIVREYVSQQLDELLGEQVFQYQKEYKVDVSMSKIRVSAESKIENKMVKSGMLDMDYYLTEREDCVMTFYPAEYIREHHKGR